MIWPRGFFTAAILSGTISGVSGQTGTVDGVLALTHGDHQRAVEILQPIAEDWRTQDAAAQFFMAGLYETGHGVSLDLLRACALYTRASANYENPFGLEAMRFARALLTRDVDFTEECQFLVNIGFQHGFEPATFDLGPQHSVEWTLTRVTVNYRDKSTRLPTPPAAQGSRFLPLHHTALATGPARSLTRNFIEVFVWRPSEMSGPWKLHWQVFEVVRDGLIGIDVSDEPLVIVGGDTPPPRESFDVREYAALTVDDQGNAEWTVLKGPRRMTQRMETDTERREVSAEALARDAALKGVDWTRHFDVHRPPSMAYTGSDGCGNAQVLGWSADRGEAVVVAAAPDLGLSTRPVVLDLAREAVNISVKVYVYATPQRRLEPCSDVVASAPDSLDLETWHAIGGSITLELSPQGVRTRDPRLRRATVTLSNVVLQNSNGKTAKLAGPIRLTAIVGWGPV